MAKSPRQGLLPGLESEPAPAQSPPTSVSAPDAGAGKSPGAGQLSPAGNSSGAPLASVASKSAGPAQASDPGTTTLRGQTVYVVDANSLIFQVFHAIPEMTSPRGEPVSAVFGFTRDLLYLLEEKRPDFLFVAFDRPEVTFRHELYEGYKGQRSEMPVDLIPQFPAIHRVLAALDIPVLDLAGYEADDILATIAELCDAAQAECFLVSGDKDCRQLISEHVRVYNIRKNLDYDAAALWADWGVRPDQVVDFQALVGDSVDSVPGVPLIGPKIARELLEKFGTLDALLDQAASLPAGKRRENLLTHREQALLSRRLVQLERHVPLAVDWNAGRVGPLDGPRLAELFAEFGFRTLTQKFAAAPASNSRLARANPGSSPSSAAAAQTESVVSAAAGQGGPLAADPVTLDYRLVDTPEKLADFLAELRQQKRIALDTETTSLWPRWAEIVGYSFSWQDGVAWYLPVRGPAGETLLDPDGTLAALRPVLEDPSVAKVGQNLKYDMIVLRAAGVALAGLEFDTILASYLLDAGERNHNLDELALRYLNHTTTKIKELIGSGKNQLRMDQVPVAQIAHYAAEDADVTWRLTAPLGLAIGRRATRIAIQHAGGAAGRSAHRAGIQRGIDRHRAAGPVERKIRRRDPTTGTRDL